MATRLMLANLLEHSGDAAAAKTELRRVLELDPDNCCRLPAGNRICDDDLTVARQFFSRPPPCTDRAAPQLALALL